MLSNIDAGEYLAKYIAVRDEATRDLQAHKEKGGRLQ